MLGQYLFIHGGTDEKGRLLADLWVLDVKKLLWEKQETNGVPPIKVSGHAVANCVLDKRILENPQDIWTEFEEVVKLEVKNVKYEGIYMFGGEEESKDGSVEVINQMRILRLGRRTLAWNIVKLKGIAPRPRKRSKMVFYKEFSALFLYGGCNKSEYFNDLFMADLTNLQWLAVNLNGDLLPEMMGHNMELIGDAILIFGGSNASYIFPSVPTVCKIVLEYENIKQEIRTKGKFRPFSGKESD